jgi:hypothetical protein
MYDEWPNSHSSGFWCNSIKKHIEKYMENGETND